MFKNFWKGSTGKETKKELGNSSTSGTDDLEEKMSPKQQYE
jgi:hypothetical protein